MAYEQINTSEVNVYTPDQYSEGIRHYNLQNALFCQKNYLKHIYFDRTNNTGDWISSVYSDRISDETEQRLQEHGFQFKYVLKPNVSSTNIIKFAKLVFNRKDITGARIVTFTNVATGYQIYRLDAIAKAKDTPQDKETWESNSVNTLSYHVLNGKNYTYYE